MMLALPASGQTSGQTPNQLASETADNSTADVSDDNASVEQLASAPDSLSDAIPDDAVIEALVREAVTAHPGMQVTVDIIGGKRTVLDYILSPIKRASNVAFREI